MARPVIRQSSLILPVAQRDFFAARGNFIRLVTSADPVRFVIDDSVVILEEGEAIYFDEPFDRIGLEHDAVAPLPIVLRVGFNSRDDSTKIGGSITSIPTRSAGANTHAGYQVTAASSQALAANANRVYLMLQNRDPAVTVFANLSGAVATVGNAGNGIRLQPGESFKLEGPWVTTSAITVIGDAAMAAANLLVVEGD